ncbi:MAG: shikimate dehydrogenase [Alphaproteobacteria bacterium]|nr:shikimate dehydrogenase [Alphaproteobacteria bacterium]
MMKDLTGKTQIAGVMGWPVGHSRSPRLHGYWLTRYGLDGAYIPLPVKPDKIGEALRALPVLGLRGANLTIPHKETAIPFLDEIDDLARRVGAVNTAIVREDGSLLGTNTDVFGFSQNLLTAGFSGQDSKKAATVLGAGGAARAVIVALEDMGFESITIVNRSLDKAEKLRDNLQQGKKLSVQPWDKLAGLLEQSSLLVNTTSLGMVGQPELEIDLSPLPLQAWVTDIVYTPLMTSLLSEAKKRGNPVVDGLGMLLHQGRPGFAAWFGKDPEVTEDLRSFVLGESLS